MKFKRAMLEDATFKHNYSGDIFYSTNIFSSLKDSDFQAHFNRDTIFGFSLNPTELNSRLKLGPTNNCRVNDQIGMI